MLSPSNAPVIRFMAFTAALAVIAGCSKPKEKETAAGLLPNLSTVAEVDTALSRAGNRMVVVDCYADWCKPCRILAPVLHELAREFKGKADFYRVDTDRNAELANAFGIRGIPHVVFLKNGRAVYALTGVYPKERYAGILTACEDADSAADCIHRLQEKR
jgi:thioredoxin